MLELKEGHPSPVGDLLTQQEILSISKSDRFEVDWPSPKNDHQAVVTPRGWIGHIPVTDQLVALVAPKVPIARLFEMLEVAYDLRSFRLLGGTTHIDGIAGLVTRLASILASRTLDRARRGLYGGYREATDFLTAARGRVDVRQTVRQLVRGRVGLTCTFGEHSRDLEDNRILLWTLHKVARLEGLSNQTRRQVMDAHRALRGLVNLEPCLPGACVGRSYSRLNEDYEPMHALCRMLLEHMGPNIEAGNRDFIPFTLHMPSLFELFISRWLKGHLPTNWSVHTQQRVKLTSNTGLEVRIDIVIRSRQTGTPVAVIDTKYKNVEQPSMIDIQQSAFYANELGVGRALLIYPAATTRPLWMRNGNVVIETLNFDLAIPMEDAGNQFLSSLAARLAADSAGGPH